MQRYGVLIASSRFPGESRLTELRCPENDVDGLNEILKSTDHGQFTETLVLKNVPHHEVMRAIESTLNKAERNDLVLIYYSGHGKLNPAGKLHLSTIDTTLNLLGATSIPIERIRSMIETTNCKKVVLILDCCYSGAVEGDFVKIKGGVDDHLNLLSGGWGTYIMTASTGIQVAREKESDQYGIFTKHIIQGIHSGEADLDGDGLVSMSELYHYVHDRVSEEGRQTPMKWDLNVRGELFIARSGKTLPTNIRLYVETVPPIATVRILNFETQFVQGMELDPGSYQVEVSSEGYETKKEWIELDARGVKHIVIKLQKIPVPPNGELINEPIFWSFWVLAISIGWFASWSLNHYVIIPAVEGKRGDAQIVGIITGVIIGLSQWIVLRLRNPQVIPWLLALWWVGATTAGITTNCVFDVAWPNSKFYDWALWGAILGIFQVFVLYFILELEISRAAWWILMSALGTALGSLWHGKSPLWPFTNLLVGTVYGAITGFGLVWLLRQRNHGN